MDNGRFNELYQSMGESRVEIKNIKKSLDKLILKVDDLGTKMTRIYTIAGAVGAIVSLIVTAIIRLI